MRWWSPGHYITQYSPDPVERALDEVVSAQGTQMFVMRKCPPGEVSLSDQLQTVPFG